MLCNIVKLKLEYNVCIIKICSTVNSYAIDLLYSFFYLNLEIVKT